MKKLLFALVIGATMIGAGSALACHPETGIGCNDTVVQVPSINTDGTGANAQNLQFQTQVFEINDLGVNGGITNLSQNQSGTGSSDAELGSSSFENHLQGQQDTDSMINSVTEHNFDSTTVTSGMSEVPSGPGEAFHGEFQTVELDVGTLSDNAGTASLAGSSMLIDQCVVAGAENGTAGAGAGNLSHSDYFLTNTGPNSQIDQAGSQDSSFVTGAGVGVDKTGGAGANLLASQLGGTAAINNGIGTDMMGGGAATGVIDVSYGSTSKGFSGSEGAQTQVHAYNQTAGIGSDQSQWGSGIVSTTNTIDVGQIESGYNIPGN